MKKQTKQKLIYLRYILPPILLLLTLIVGLIPSYRYVIGAEAHQKVSLWNLLSESWTVGRQTLFATPDATYGETAFSKINLTLIIIFALLFLVALIASVWSCYVALKYFISDDEEDAEKSRTLFITVFPNRIILTAVECLALALCLYPYIIPALYAGTLAMNVRIALVAPDCLIFAALSLIGISLLSALSAPMERRFDADVFKRRRPFELSGEQENGEEEDYAPLFDTQDEDSEEKNALREAQAERIRRILRKDDDSTDS